MTSREYVKKEIDTLPDETISLIQEFILFQKYRLKKQQEYLSAKQPKMVLGVEVPEGEEDDPFYSEPNIHAVLGSMKDAEEGRLTEHELIAV
jgi:hypothetical protein